MPSLLLFLPLLASLINLSSSDDSLVPLSNSNFSQGPPINATFQEVPVSSLPGWHIQGTVQYIQAGGNITLPDSGRGVQLGKAGRISQAFSVDSGSVYSLTFSLASAGDNCSTIDLLNVAVSSQSASFLLEQKYSDTWETHAWGFSAVGNQDNLTFSNQLSEEPVQQDPNITCGPVLDTIFLKKLSTTNASSTGNLLTNGGFEEGPYVLPESSFGVLLEDITDTTTSPIPGWAVTGTVKYIDAGHYLLPGGSNAAIELVGGVGAGVEQSVSSTVGSGYMLSFHMGDGKDLCLGNMSVQAKAGDGITNFTFTSTGNGTYDNFTMRFMAVSGSTNVSIVNLLRNEDQNLIFCGPVIDNLFLAVSSSSSFSCTSLSVFPILLACFIPFLVMLVAS